MNLKEMIQEIDEDIDGLAESVDYDDDDSINEYAELASRAKENFELIKSILIVCPVCGQSISKEPCMLNNNAHAKCSSCRREFKLVEVK